MRVLILRVDGVLQHVHDVVRLGKGVRVDRSPWLVDSVGILGGQQSQEDISAGSPIPVVDVVAFAGG